MTGQHITNPEWVIVGFRTGDGYGVAVSDQLDEAEVKAILASDEPEPDYFRWDPLLCEDQVRRFDIKIKTITIPRNHTGPALLWMFWGATYEEALRALMEHWQPAPPEPKALTGG